MCHPKWVRVSSLKHVSYVRHHCPNQVHVVWDPILQGEIGEGRRIEEYINLRGGIHY